MGIVKRIKNWFGIGGDYWTPIGGRGNRSGMGGGFGTYDVYGSQPEPGAWDLIGAYEDCVYSCVNLISNNVSGVRVKLVGTTDPGELSPRYPARSIPGTERKRLETEWREFTRKAARIEEITDHPLLDLIAKPNPHYGFGKLLGMTDVYLELTGSAFWFLGRDELTGEVRELWLLPSQNITIETDEAGRVTSYLNQPYQTSKPERLSPDDVIHFKYLNPADPYSSFGTPPLRAVWQRVQLLRQEQSSWQSVLTNMALPSALVAPPAGEFWTDLQTERVSKMITERFRMGNQGGPFVVPEGITYTPVSNPPKDLAALSMYEQIKSCVANVYAVPRPLLDMQDSNYASAQTAWRFFQMNCLKPRVKMIFETITHHLCPDRLFLSTDDVVEPDRTFELQRTSALWQANLINQNEARTSQGLDPVQGGEKYLYQLIGTSSGGGTMGTLPSFQSEARSLDTVKKKSLNLASAFPDPMPLAEVLREFFREHRDELFRGFKSSGTWTGKAFIPLDQWTRELAAVLEPVLRVYVEEGSGNVLAALGGDDPLRRLDVLNLDRIVNGLALALADSTLATTDQLIGEAIENTREAIRQGLAEGEANRQLTERIEAIYTNLSEYRAYLIAETESSRAKNAGEVAAIQDAGVNCRKVWLCDNMACDICRDFNGVAKELDEPFGVLNHGPYGVVDHPPAHPACRCTLQYEFPEGEG